MAEENRAPPGTSESPPEERVVKNPTEARQGQIVLGKYAHLIWIGAVVVIVILALVFWSV